MLNDVAERVADRVAADANIQIDWQVIYEFLLELIEECFGVNDKIFVASIKDPTIHQRALFGVRLRRYLREIDLRGVYEPLKQALLAEGQEIAEEEGIQCLHFAQDLDLQG
jgi:hypothetical protein